MFSFLTVVLGFFVLIAIGVSFFLHFLRVGLDTSSSVRIDAKPKA